MRRIDLLVVIVLLACTQGTLGTQGTQSTLGTSKGEWTHYSGNAASHKYSPLDQVNKDNVGKLQIAWRWASPDNAVVVHLHGGEIHPERREPHGCRMVVTIPSHGSGDEPVPPKLPAISRASS